MLILMMHMDRAINETNLESNRGSLLCTIARTNSPTHR